VAQSDPTNLDATDEIRRATKYTVRFFLATRSSIQNSLNFAYYSDNLTNVGIGNEVEFTFGKEGDGLEMSSGGYAKGTVPRGGPGQQAGQQAGQQGGPQGGQQGLPMQDMATGATYQPPADEGLSFGETGSQTPLPMTGNFHGEMSPVPQNTEESVAREPPTQMAPKPPPRDELLDEKLGRSGSLGVEDNGPREIQIELGGPGSVAMKMPPPPPTPDSGLEHTAPGWPAEGLPNISLSELVTQVEDLTAGADSLEEAISINRSVLEALLRLLITKGVLSRDEAMSLVQKKE